MKKTILLALASLLFICVVASGQPDGIGIGIIAGEPTGVSIKKWIDSRSAIDRALAWSFVDEGSFQIHTDYLRHNFSFTKEMKGRMPLYYGVGARIKLKGNGKGSDDARLGVRIPLGLTYLFEEESIDAFVEVVPILDITPETDIKINAAIGVRYYFK